MEIRQLRYFIAVAENLNFTEASRQLFVAQSAISHQIAQLEREIGVELLIRTKRCVRMTTAGSVFLKEAREVLRQADMATQKARNAEAGVVGSVRIGFLSPGSAARMFMPAVIRNFHSEYPQIEVGLQQHSASDLVEAVRSGELDLGITPGLKLGNATGLVWEKIHSGESMVVVPADHRLAGQERVDLAWFADEPFIVLARQEALDMFLKQCAAHSFAPRIVGTAPFLETLLFLVEAGIGVAMVPDFARDYGCRNLSFLGLCGEVAKYEVLMMWHKDNDNPSLGVFIDEIRKELGRETDAEPISPVVIADDDQPGCLPAPPACGSPARGTFVL